MSKDEILKLLKETKLSTKHMEELEKIADQILRESTSTRIVLSDGRVEMYHPSDSYFWVTTKDPEDLRMIMKTLPPNPEKYKYTDGKVSDTNMGLTINNPARPSNTDAFEIQVCYNHGNSGVRVKLPIELVKNFLETGHRGATDSEHVYFMGTPHHKLRELRLLAYNFKFDPTGKVFGWYGGDKSTCNGQTIDTILTHLLNEKKS